jgi:arylsulfatase A-like enzyme
VIFVSDNGSNGSVVKVPFDPTRAKSLPYQTGVWVPGIVAGPVVAHPGREVAAMVNIVDIFQLIGELAGISVHGSVPRTLDARPMLPYLINPNQASIRKMITPKSGRTFTPTAQSTDHANTPGRFARKSPRPGSV